MSGRRSTGDSWRALGARLRAIESERVAGALVAAGAAIAVFAIVFGGYVSFDGVLVELLYPFALLLPVVGAAVILVACWWAWSGSQPSVSSLLEGPPPEAGVTRTKRAVGRETGWSLDFAARAWYRCETNNSVIEIRTHLQQGAVRALRASRGLEGRVAREAVRQGTWTDDPVAAAFLADERGQPVDERLRGAVDPGTAHHRRVRRTLAAIEAVEDGDGAADRTDAATTAEVRTR